MSVSNTNWYVLYTRSRTEKAVADRLSKLGIEVYCPMTKTRRQWSDRMKVVEEPLFRCYCFVRLPEAERNRVFIAAGVVRYLFWQQQPAKVRDEEIDTIRRLLNDEDHERLVVRKLMPGERVTIASGSFSELKGEVVDQQGRVAHVVLDSLQLIVKVNMERTAIWVHR